jgi:enediyne biosynthesis protein E4
MKANPKMFFVLLMGLVNFVSCNSDKATDTKLPMYRKKENTGINFENDTHKTKKFNIFNYRNFFNAGGIAIGNINNDVLADVFLQPIWGVTNFS